MPFYSSFPGEPYFDTPLPNYERERFWITLQLVVAAMFFFVWLPVQLSPKNEQGQKELSVLGSIILTITGLLVMALIILNSPYNKFLPRSVWEAPLLFDDECQAILEMAHRVAALNADMQINHNDTVLLRDPAGWRKDRHESYPTTDLNLITDPFTKEDRAYLEELWNRRLGPLMARVYGIPEEAIRANDMFIVRYDGHQGQPFLRRHTDANHISFNILLNMDFEGGGTRYHNRLTGAHKDVHPLHRGNVILNAASLEHEGLATIKGTRYIFVGFTSIDTFDPFTKKPIEGISWFASWLCLNWLQVRFNNAFMVLAADSNKEAVRKLWWADNQYMLKLFRAMDRYFTVWLDYWAPHRVVSLIRPEHRLQYLQKVDEQESFRANQRKANWFRGQQVLVDVDGNIAKIWAARRKNEEAFLDL